MEFIDELTNVQPIDNIIPNGCLSFEEEAKYVADMLITEYNRYCLDLGRTEISFYEATGSNIIYEGEEAEKSGNKAKKFMTKAFAAFKSFTDKVSTYADGSVAAGKKLAKLTPEMIKSIPEGKELGVTHTFFDPAKIKFATNALKFAAKVDSAFKKSAKKDKEAIKAMCDEFESKIFYAITSISNDNPKEVRKQLRDSLIGDTIKVDKAYVIKNLSRIERVIKGDMAPNMAKTMYNDQKILASGVYKVVEEYQNKPEYADLIPMWMGLITEIFSTTMVCYAIMFDVTKRMHREYMTIVSKALKATNSKKINESFYEAPEVE